MEHDVLIIGAGPTGAIAAKRLAEEGYRVLVLEQGDWPDYSKATVHREDFPLTAGRDWGWDPNLRQAPGDYPDRRHRVRHHGADVERRRRRHRRVRGAVAAQHAVGLPREDARRDRRRLAADLRGPRAVLRARRARLRHLRPGERHRVPARRRARRCRPCRWGPRAGGWRRRTTSWAGTGGPRRTRSPRATTAGCTPASRSAPACRPAPTARRARRTSRTGRRRSSSGSSCAPARGSAS